MGPRFNGVEDSFPPPKPISAAVASMGPRFNGVEDLLRVGKMPQ